MKSCYKRVSCFLRRKRRGQEARCKALKTKGMHSPRHLRHLNGPKSSICVCTKRCVGETASSLSITYYLNIRDARDAAPFKALKTKALYLRLLVKSLRFKCRADFASDAPRHNPLYLKALQSAPLESRQRGPPKNLLLTLF